MPICPSSPICPISPIGQITATRRQRQYRIGGCYAQFTNCSQYRHRNPCAGFRVCQGVVVLREVIPAGGSHGLQLVIGQAVPEMPARGAERVHK